MEELLKELGYTNEQIKAIVDGMKNKKIFTSAEENIDTRYSKLNEDFETQKTELETANNLIEELKKGSEGNEDLQNKVTTYEKEIADLKAKQHENDIDNALKLELLKNKAKADDIDYLIFKIKAKQKDTKKDFEVDENGNLKDFNVEDVKKEYKNNFEDASGSFVDVKKLGGSDGPTDDDKEPQSLGEALKDAYMEDSDL